MNHKSLTTLLLGIIASLCLATQCKKEEETPKNTFSALVNGEPFTKAGWTLKAPTPLSANYFPDRKVLSIICDAANPGFFYINLTINNPHEGENLLSRAYFADRSLRAFACENCTRVFITKFDTKNLIVSGTFEFSGKQVNYMSLGRDMEYISDSIVHITEGRFNVRLTIID